MNFRPAEREEPEINLTSLIDVVLLLLIFFMVSTSFIREAEIKIRLPEASLSPVPRETRPSLEITITANGNYLVNQRELLNNRSDTLRAAIIKEVGKGRDLPVTIRADANTNHQSVVRAMDVAGRLGFVHINIATVHEAAAAR